MVNFFTKEEEKGILEAIRIAEHRTSGEIHVHVRKKCKKDPMMEAQEIFRRLGIHRTEERNGILIFVAAESRQFAIVGDSGIHEKVSHHFWDTTRDKMLEFFKKNEIKNGVVAGIQSAGEKLEYYFPAKPGLTNQLPDAVTED